MNIFITQSLLTTRFVALVTLFSLVLSALPASFATGGGFVGGIVAGCMEEGAINFNPGANTEDGSCTYPAELVDIKICKYVYNPETENSDPVSDWTVYLYTVEPEGDLILSSYAEPEYTLVTEGEEGEEEGCITQAVDPEEGPWFASEEMQVGWSQNSVAVYDGELMGVKYESEYCEFFGEERPARRLAEGASFAPRCDFYNDDDRELVTGFKWNDANNNGIHEVTEPGIAGWTITATNDPENKYDYEPVEAITAEDGSYSLLLPWDGEWTITEETRLNWTQTNVIMDGELLNTIDSEEPYTSCTFEWYDDEDGDKFSDKKELTTALTDMASSCDFLNYEAPRRSSGGGSGTRVKDRAPQGVVLGAATSTQQCGMYLNDYMRQGKATSSTEVTKLQIFLNAVGIKLEVTGDFDTATDAAVRGFQAQHKAEVLTPWYLAKIVPHENPTGWVYQLTRWKINNIVCPGSEAYPVLN